MMMNHILASETATGNVIVYLNNILIFTEDSKLYTQLVKQVLLWLRANNLFTKSKKCFFEADKIEYLGMIISYKSITID